MGAMHLLHYIRPQAFTHEQVAFDDLISLFAKRPDLVGGAVEIVGVGQPVTMQSKYGAEGAELEPAHNELAEGR